MKNLLKFAMLFVLGVSLATSVQAATRSKSLVEMGKTSAGDGPTVITSDKLEFDYNEFIALFDGHVVVKNSKFTLKADRMLVCFEHTNDIKRVDAVGNVDLKSGDMRAVCGKATYTSSDGKILIQNNPVVSKGENSIAGNKMSIWLNDERVVVEDDVSLETQPKATTP